MKARVYRSYLYRLYLDFGKPKPKTVFRRVYDGRCATGHRLVAHLEPSTGRYFEMHEPRFRELFPNVLVPPVGAVDDWPTWLEVDVEITIKEAPDA